MSTLARLEITDGVTTVDLMADRVGYHLAAWRPAVAAYKNEGVFQSNPWADGRRLLMRRFDNTVETLDLKANDDDQDSLIETTQTLRRLLESAADYWEHEYNSTPVYLIARAACETNTRYAVIVKGSIAEDDNPFGPVFYSGSGASMDSLSLVVERRHWQSAIPGTADCAQISALQGTEASAVSVSVSPAQSTDDAYILEDGATISLNGNGLRIGYDAAGKQSYESGIRFSNVAIPAGATILRATIVFRCLTGADTGLYEYRIFGERTVTPAVYSIWADFAVRMCNQTTVVDWHLGTMTPGVDYTTPDLSSVVQEIIGLPGWASGNDMNFFVSSVGGLGTNYQAFRSWDSTSNFPVLTIEYLTTAGADFGREATCTAEVYVDNKHVLTQLTHAYYYDADLTSYSTNRIGAVLPYRLLPAAPANGDILYIGNSTALPNAGPFSNVVFDIGAYDAAFKSGGMEYYDSGTGWTALSIISDCDRLFSAAGVKILSWKIPATWTTFAVNGVTGWWVRYLNAGAYGGVGTGPTQRNRDLYYANTPRIEIDDAQVGGDIPALCKVMSARQDGYARGAFGSLGFPENAQRIIIGLRSTARGVSFTPYINLSDVQNPAGISVTAGTNTAFASDISAPTARKMTFTAGGAEASLMRVGITLSTTMCPEYYGRFRALGIVKNVTGSYALWTLALELDAVYTSNTTEVFESEPVLLNNTAYAQIVDFGTLAMPPVNSLPTIPYQVALRLNVSTLGAGVLDLLSLILIPADEWSGEFIETGGRNTAIANNEALVIDSVTSPKNQLQAYSQKNSQSLIDWQAIAGYPVTLKNNQTQRMWFLCAYATPTAQNVWLYDPAMTHAIQVFKAQRYLSMRGAR
jgi:hypothetical protein